MKDFVQMDFDKAGQFSDIRVVARLDAIYLRFLRDLTDTNEAPLQFERVVTAYIWAASFLEARINFHLRYYMGNYYKETAEQMWDLMERLELAKKVDKLQQLTGRTMGIPGWHGLLATIIGTRNRLLHYKNDPTNVRFDPKTEFKVVGGKATGDGKIELSAKEVFDTLIAALPPAAIFVELSSKKIGEIREPAMLLGEAIQVLAEQPPQKQSAASGHAPGETGKS